MFTEFVPRKTLSQTVLLSLLMLGAGCQSKPRAEHPVAQAPAAAPAAPPVRDDQQIGLDIQAKIAAESALQGQDVKVAVANGIATLNGKVDSDAARALAAAD